MQNEPLENEKHLSKKEKRELRRQKRKLQSSGDSRGKILKRIGLGVVGVLILGGISWLIWGTIKENKRPLGQDYSHGVADLGGGHIKQGDPHDPYNSNPPTSGNHWEDPVRPGVFDRSQPDEGVMHSLEHGMIWVSYKSSIPDSAKDLLRKITRTEAGVVLTVRDANDTDIALAAWDRLDTFNLEKNGTFDEMRIRDFIRRYLDKGPEHVPAMTGKEY